jgi:hypothetical protein
MIYQPQRCVSLADAVLKSIQLVTDTPDAA